MTKNLIRHLSKRNVTCTLLAIILMTACTTSPTGRKQLMLISPNAAIVESKKAYASTVNQLSNDNKLVTDPRRLKRLQNITGKLVANAVTLYPKSINWDWSVAIIDAPETLNAWCMAGGRMAIYTGIIDKLELTDDEIAQIMGHEIAHALANHTAERMSRAIATNIGLTATAIFTENNAALLGTGAMAAKLALELPNSRTSEIEADQIGLQLTTMAGYDPNAAVTLWQKMSAANTNRQPEFLSTHPSPSNRISTLKVLAKQQFVNRQLSTSSIFPVTMIR